MGLYEISVKKLDGSHVAFSQYEGKTLLIVNVASQCGFTPQYKGLQALHKRYKNRGLCVLAFPCNDYANQEPGSKNKILEFCKSDFGVTFDLFEKIKIRGNSSHSLYKYLESLLFPVTRPKGLKAKLFHVYTTLIFLFKEGRFPLLGEVQWNFHKIIIGRNGRLIGHFSSDCDPFDTGIIKCIEAEIENNK